jgi:uncharacterized protein (DUF302 family)
VGSRRAPRREPYPCSENNHADASFTNSAIRGIPVMSGNTSVERVTIEHVTIRSGKTFAAVRTALEALVPRLDDGYSTLLRFGLADRARQELEAAATLSIFGSRDHGALLAIAGLKQQAIQYDIGNPLTASLMTRHQISAALYAPIRVLLLESPEGGVAFEYDRPVSTFGQFGDERVNIVARKLDENLENVLQKAANSFD